MKTASDIRREFVEFFIQQHGHVNVPSSPVVPHDDPTLLFANAGMNQFKPYFLGTQKPKSTRVVNTQKCIRAGGKHNDLDDVGRDTYHHTFFEMLGNWSFGDYFKKDAITWAWQLLTQVWGLDATRLHVTVFEGDEAAGIPRDDEAAEYWRAVGVPDERIHLGNKKDNFWEMGETGPCGPCTEIHIDRTADLSGGKLVNAGSEDCIEIWNNVFIQFNRNPDKTLTPLPAQHVDTGMGFERVCGVLQGKKSNYDTDVFTPLFTAIQKVTGTAAYGGTLAEYKTNQQDIAYRVIADHIRTLTFALTDGAVIGNDGRDYVLKRILRRAERYGKQYLGASGPFLHALVPAVVEQLAPAFPELLRNPEKIREQIYSEEESFLRTLDRGIKLFGKFAEKTKAAKATAISGADAFQLHDTFGILIDITEQMAEEAGLTVDTAAYKAELEASKDRARKGGKKHTVTAVKGDLPATDDSPKYEVDLCDATVLGWVQGNDVVRTGTLTAGETAALLLDRTNFYAEQGGQVGDTGIIDDPARGGAEFQVEETQRLGDSVLHFGTVLDGEIRVGQAVRAAQGTMRRVDVMRNHTATHLLNLALREVLGQHVEQKGSLVDDDKTRFDFSHDKPVDGAQLREIERKVNTLISKDLPVTAVTMPLAEAKAIPGVRAVFGEKYPDPVRVVLIGPETPALARHDDSVEFCGGTHVPRTGGIGYFKIVANEGVAKGVRRVVAVTGRAALDRMQSLSTTIEALTARFNCKPEELLGRIEVLHEEMKTLQASVARAQAADLVGAVDKMLADAPTVNGIKLVVGRLPAAGADAYRTQVDRVRQMASSALMVFLAADGDKVPVVVALTPDLVAKGLKAGEIIKPIAEAVGGKGGGKPDMAQAGGKDASKIDAALKLAGDAAATMLAALK
jgi:alanyl-tRNA synthetase